jgi:uncharacterized protein (DUF1919 family)
MSTSTKNCNFSCTCNREDCDRKHYIEDPEDRVKVKELFDNHFDRKIHNETDPDGVRNTPCFFGPLCGKSECNYKHYCRFEFRSEVMNKEWRKISRRDNKEKLLEEMKEKYEISDEDMERLAKL